MQRMCICISVMCKYCQRALLCYTNIVDKFSRSANFIGFFNPPSLPLNLIATMLHVLCTIYMYICSPPSLRGNFCNTKFVYDFVVFSFECHLMYQWQFSSNIWILWLRHLMNKWQFSFNVCLLCFCPQTELACVDKKMYRFFLLLLIVVLFDFLNIRNIKISNKTVLHM